MRLNVRASTNLLHRIASVSKIFTHAAINELVKEGILGMDMRVFPEIFGNDFNYSICQNSENITVGHLLNHMVGAWPTSTRAEDPMFSRVDLNHRILI